MPSAGSGEQSISQGPASSGGFAGGAAGSHPRFPEGHFPSTACSVAGPRRPSPCFLKEQYRQKIFPKILLDTSLWDCL